MSAPPTIPSWKTAFLDTQTNILSRPLAPSHSWNSANQTSKDAPPIPEAVLAEAMADINVALQKHCRRVYPPQASRNVAEQINNLYLSQAERALASEEGAKDGGIGRESDLTNRQTIDELPVKWLSDKDVSNYPMESKRYADSAAQLKTLSERRNELQQRAERLRKMKALLQPLSRVEDIQGNLVARNGEVEKELERMRMLLVRVSGRVGTLPSSRQDEPAKIVGDLEEGRKRKVDEFLTDGTVFPK